MLLFKKNVGKKKLSECLKLAFFILFLINPFFAQGQNKVEKTQTMVKTLVWSDEFDYNGLPDTNKWNFQLGKARANNEPQYYTNDLKNVLVDDGKLTIGVWPAIWTLGLTGRWPACGEIDIMEFWGHNPNTIGANVHTHDYNHTKGTGRGGEIVTQDPWKDYHIYAVEWFPDRMDFYFDDKMFYSCKSKGEGIGEWPFFEHQYLILNLALWNNWKGQPGIDDSIFPQEFIADYVRVYEMK